MTVRIFLLIAAFYFVGFFTHALFLKKTVYGDGIFYYAWLRSAVVDRDFDFTNEYRHFGVAQPVSPTGIIGNKYTIGPAILWSPLYYWTHLLIRDDGYGLPYQLAVGYTSVALTLFGLVLLYRILTKKFPRLASLWTVASLAGASNLAFYGSLDAVNSHALSFFTAVVLLTLVTSRKLNWFLIGTSLALIGLIRQQDLIYGLILIPLLISEISAIIKNSLKFFLGFLLFFSPQLFAWQILYGNFWQSPYLINEGFNFLKPQIFGTLFSPTNGLFLLTPITAIGFFGLIWQKHWVYLIIFLLQLLIVSSWSTWWQGASFSGRMFVGTLPLLSFGLAEVFSWLGKRILLQRFRGMLLVLPLTVLNVLAIIRFLLLT